MSGVDDWGLWLTAVVGGLIALGWLIRKAAKLLVWVARLFKLLDYQMRNNGGGSLLDKVDANTKRTEHLHGTVTELAGSVEQLSGRFDTHLQTTAEANREMWPAVKAVAEAQPPE